MKCSKCNADITGMDSHICAGSTVAGIKTDAIEDCISWRKDDAMAKMGRVSKHEHFCAEHECTGALNCDAVELAEKRGEKRGYNLAGKRRYNEISHCDEVYVLQYTYEQAVQERDGGAK